MGLKPEFRLTANSADITAAVQSRLISMRWTDEAGMDSDVLEISLADHDPAAPIALPPTGAELDLSLGYDGALQRVGKFVADEVELTGWPGEMTIRARAAPFETSKGGKATLQSQKTRSWPKGTKLGDLVRKIAKEHSLEPAVAASMAAIVLPHLDQADESDLHFLVRVALKYDAIVKPSGGKLVLAKRGESRSTSGQALPAVTLTPADVGRFRLSLSRRDAPGMVIACYHATRSARRHEVKVGEGEPVTRLRMYYQTAEMAQAAARAELDRRKRGRVTLSVGLPGRTDLMAEGRLLLNGFRDGIPRDWIITRVEHRMDGAGYTCDVDAEQPNAEGQVMTQDTEA